MVLPPVIARVKLTLRVDETILRPAREAGAWRTGLS